MSSRSPSTVRKVEEINFLDNDVNDKKGKEIIFP